MPAVGGWEWKMKIENEIGMTEMYPDPDIAATAAKFMLGTGAETPRELIDKATEVMRWLNDTTDGCGISLAERCVQNSNHGASRLVRNACDFMEMAEDSLGDETRCKIAIAMAYVCTVTAQRNIQAECWESKGFDA